MRLLHLSDLHICSAKVEPRVRALVRECDALFEWYGLGRLQLDLQCTDPTRLDVIKDAVSTLKPDVICITGDITAFGDSVSFEEATRFVTDLQAAGNGPRVVVTPGNHDVLSSQLGRLLADMDGRLQTLSTKISRLALWIIERRMLRVKALRDKLRSLVGSPDVAISQANPLGHYLKFAQDSRCLSGDDPVGTIDDCAVSCIPFSSVSMDPLWMNIGDGRTQEFQRFRAKLVQARKAKQSLVVALIHHNPISAPDIVESSIQHAYNAFPGASSFVKEMQDDGVDIILFGHQHRSSVCQVDFIPSKPGHLFLIGASSATSDERAGCNVIDITDRFHAKLQRYAFSTAGRCQKDGPSEDLVFECDRVSDLPTVASRYEVRHLISFNGKVARTQEKGTGGIEDGAEDLLIVRPRGSELRAEETLDELKRVLRNEKNKSIRVLLSDPDLFSIVSDLPEEKRRRLSLMWGDPHDWEDQAHEAGQSLSRLRKFKRDLEEPLKRKLLIRRSHTLVPVGAVLRTEQGKKRLVYLRLLPVGVGKLGRPELKLEQRHGDGISEFYSSYLEALWAAGKEEPK